MPPRRAYRALMAASAGAVVVCIALGSTRPVQAWLLGTRGFTPDTVDGRLRLESGVSDDAATLIRGVLDEATADVARVHGRPFPHPVRVYLCVTQASFNKRTAASPHGNARGAVFAGRLFLSPRAFATGTYRGVLAHELSHLHGRQILGTAYTTRLPGWFQEGLAVFVAGGGGAEPVPESEARAAIRHGDRLSPEDAGAVFPRRADAHGLRHHMFYRQAALFVAYLAEREPEAFDALLAALLGGAAFRDAFEATYGQSVAQAWASFVREAGS